MCDMVKSEKYNNDLRIIFKIIILVKLQCTLKEKSTTLVEDENIKHVHVPDVFQMSLWTCGNSGVPILSLCQQSVPKIRLKFARISPGTSPRLAFHSGLLDTHFIHSTSIVHLKFKLQKSRPCNQGLSKSFDARSWWSSQIVKKYNVT